jgi:hypothetical protein
MKQVVCVKWGRGYGAHYVNRLYAMVARHVTPPFRLVCLTDDRAGVRSEIECFDLPDLGVPHPANTLGKWRKQVLWERELPGLAGVALYIDLDSVIVDSIDPYFEHGSADDVILARNWSRPMQRLGQTSVFRFNVGANPHLIDNFRADPQGIADKYRFEQHYVTANVTGGIKFWPEAWTCLFRLHSLPQFPLRYFVRARIPRGVRIVTFAGGPKPDDVVLGRWNEKSPPHPSRRAHLRATFGPARVERSAWRHLKGFVLAPGWLEQHWRE